MRSFSFRAKNIGRERYLTYVSGEGSEIDEDVLDYCEENNIKELIDIIFEEDDDYDYLTYDITGRMTLEKYVTGVMDCEKVLNVLRNIALGLVSCKEQAIHLSYILLNKGFIYIDPDSLEIKFICLPVESEAAVSVEFKSFVRQFLANLRYNVEEDLGYVGKLITYINSDSFNLRGLIGLLEAIMEDVGMDYNDAGVIESEDGAEVVNIADDADSEEIEKKEGLTDFMSSLDSADEVLPEIGDDEEEFDEELEETTEAEDVTGIKIVAEKESMSDAATGNDNVETTAEAGDETKEAEFSINSGKTAEDQAGLAESVSQTENDKSDQKEDAEGDSIEDIKARIEKIVGRKVPVAKTVKDEAHSDQIRSLDELDEFLDKKPVVKKTAIKVNKAAIIQSAAEHEEEDKEETVNEPQKQAESKAADKDVQDNGTELLNTSESNTKTDSASTARTVLGGIIKSASTAGNSILGTTGTLKISPYLIRVNTEERIMLTKPVFKIGKATRGVDYTVDGNGAVSRQHAVIMQKDGACYIKDNKSTNHTYVDGKRLEDGEEEILRNDCKVRLGDEEFVFKLR